MTEISNAAMAEKIAARRARISIAMGVLLLVQQGAFFSDGGLETRLVGDVRNVDLVQMISWFIWVAVLLLLVRTGGGLWQKAEVRELINDESTKAHRNAALATGFWAMSITALGLYLLSMFEPVGEQVPMHFILTFGIAAALIQFGKLERSAIHG